MFYLICGKGALLGCCAHPVCIFSLTTVVCVGSGMRTAKHSSFITAACTLLFMSSTGVRVSLPPGLEPHSVLVCTVTRHAHTHLSTLNTAPHCGRRFSSPYIMGFNQDHIDRQMEEAFGPHLLRFQYKRPAETAQETPTREVKTAKGAEGKGVGSAQSSADPKGNGRVRGRGNRGRTQNKSWGSGGGGFSGGFQSAQTPSQSSQAFIPDAQMCRLMARTIVDQADTIAVLRQSTAWVMWLQTTQPSLIPTMAAAAALWKEKVGDRALWTSPQGCAPLGAASDPEAHFGVSAAGAADRCERAQVDRSTGQLGVPTLEPCDSYSGTGCEPPVPESDRPHLSPEDHRDAVGWRDSQSVRCHSPPSGIHGGGSDLQGGHSVPIPSCESTVCQSGTNGRPLSPLPSRPVPPQGELPTIEWHPETSGMVRLRRTIWNNPGNLCYMNALVRCLCWSIFGFPHWDHTMSRLGSAAMRALFLRTAPVCPFDLRSWRSLLSRWANPFAQQDCAEFLAHVAECLRSSLLAGGWDARVLEDGIVRVVDSGLNSCTISLDLPNTSRIDLQALVGAWHGQHSVHALRFPSQVLILRIARYRQAASGVILKNPCTVTWSRFLSVPAFTDASLTNAMLRYRICAVTYHVGPLLTSGHVTSWLMVRLGLVMTGLSPQLGTALMLVSSSSHS